MNNIPFDIFINILLFDVSNINKLKLLNRDSNDMIEYYLKHLLSKKFYFTLNLKIFENKIFLHNFLHNFFKDTNSISKKVNCYTLIYDLIDIKYIDINNIINNIYLFFEKKCYIFAIESLKKNDFSIYEENTTKIKIILKHIDKTYVRQENLNDISKRIYDETKNIK